MHGIRQAWCIFSTVTVKNAIAALLQCYRECAAYANRLNQQPKLNGSSFGMTRCALDSPALWDSVLT